jgi:hypothetical protein
MPNLMAFILNRDLMNKLSHILIACCLTLGGCCNEDFIIPEEEGPDYDFYEGALDISDLMNTCSADGAFTTVGATPDQNSGSCQVNTTPVANRWFKFRAAASGVGTVTVSVDFGKGTQRRTQVTLWAADGTTELDCGRAFDDNDTVSFYTSGFTPGEYYYISVDVGDGPGAGTFTICLSDTD